jgi:hypothetical protein
VYFSTNTLTVFANGWLRWDAQAEELERAKQMSLLSSPSSSPSTTPSDLGLGVTPQREVLRRSLNESAEAEEWDADEDAHTSRQAGRLLNDEIGADVPVQVQSSGSGRSTRAVRR